MLLQEILSIAYGEIGNAEIPNNGIEDTNNIKYTQDYYREIYNNQKYSGPYGPWCLIFIRWLFKEKGVLNLLYNGDADQICVSCTDYYYALYNCLRRIENGNYQPGDLLFFDWDGNGDCDHVGIVYESDATTLNVIEGNTSNNKVELKNRFGSTKIVGAIRINYDETTEDNTESEEDNMTGEQIVMALSDEQAYELITKAHAYLAKQNLPTTWDAQGELEQAVALGITDGLNPLNFVQRYEAAIMVKRAVSGSAGGGETPGTGEEENPEVGELLIYNGGDDVLEGTFTGMNYGTAAGNSAVIADGAIQCPGVLSNVTINGQAHTNLSMGGGHIGPIDMTGFTTLHALCYQNGNGGSAVIGYCDSNAGINEALIASANTSATDETEITVDISGVTGEHYVATRMTPVVNVDTITAYFTKIWLT